MKIKASKITPILSTVFEDAYWKLRLFGDLSLDVKQKTGGAECGDYEHVYDFLEDQHETLRTADADNAVHRLAEHINYPLCLFEDWIEDGRAKRSIEANN
ncbi:MAG: hypothetical protein WKF92_14850 [Pyrinomonadaceae bacterium]